MEDQSKVKGKDSDVGSIHFSKDGEEGEEGEGSEGFIKGENDDEKGNTTSKRSKKLTSIAWDHFDLIMRNGIRKAKCKYCQNELKYTGHNGTSPLLKHTNKSCPRRHLRLAEGQSQLKFKTEVDGSSSLAIKEKPKKVIFDQEVSRKELVKMVVIHEYPLSIVDHMGFRSFVRSLNDNFKMISRNTLKSYVLKMYNVEKSSLKVSLERNEGRVAITTDMWTASNQKKGYMAVTSHFIDNEWVLHNRTLRNDCDVELMKVRKTLDKLVREYQKQSDVVNDQLPMKRKLSECKDEDGFAREKRQKVRTLPQRGEVDRYLESPTMLENDQFDVLAWWKGDTNYLTLQKITKDILAIPVSSVALESAFSMGGRVVSIHRSRLHSQTVEALMCLQSWMVDDIKGC